MRRFLQAVVGGCVGIVLLLGIAAYATFGGLRANIAEDLPGIGYRVMDGYVAVDVVDVGDGRVLLIDAGIDPGAAPILGALGARGTAPSAVAAVFLTHAHGDHVAGVPMFPDAAVYAMAAELPALRGEVGFEGPLPRLFGPGSAVRVTHPVEDGATVTIGSRVVRALLVPGHTHGSAAWLIDGTLFVGDSASLGSDGSLVGAPWVFSDSTSVNRASLARLRDRLRDEGVTRIVTSHTGTGEGAALAAFPG